MLIIFLPCIKLGGKLLKLGDKLPGMGGKKKPGADLPDGHGTPGGQHLPDVNDSDAMDWSTKLGMARMITELHDQVDTPVGVLIPLLNSTIASKSQAFNGYRAEMTGPGRYDIVQFTKKKHDPAKVKEGFTTGKEEEKKKPMLGANGAQTGSKTMWKEQDSRARIDIENPAPGKRPGQIHYQDKNDQKYLYDPEKGAFFSETSTGVWTTPAPREVAELLNNLDIQAAIEKALRYLGEK